jgi:hypothetical protein
MLRVFNRGSTFDDVSWDLRNPRRRREFPGAHRFRASELAAMGVASVINSYPGPGLPIINNSQMACSVAKVAKHPNPA